MLRFSLAPLRKCGTQHKLLAFHKVSPKDFQEHLPLSLQLFKEGFFLDKTGLF